MKLNENEKKVLMQMNCERDDFAFSNFAWLTEVTGLDRKSVRRACRSLTRKGLAVFQKGLWTSEGDPAGAGYAATWDGFKVGLELKTQCCEILP